MATGNARKARTAADIVAAVKLGSLDPSTPIATAEEAAAAAESAEMLRTMSAAEQAGQPEHTANGTEHECAIPGCRHGAAHTGTTQPDRQVKLQCPVCGAVARMTQSALNKSFAIECQRDRVTFVPAARRTYNRKAV